ncbi:MAG: lysophospholipase [Leptospira sp.]|nr:lysophospholipase [Leptospira sp.]
MPVKELSPYTSEEHDFFSEDGIKIYYRIFRPVSRKKISKILVVHHGFGEHSGRYWNLLHALEDSGIVVYLLDARGHGRSGGKRGHINRFFDFLDDLDTLIKIAIRNEKIPKVYLMGHSMGGLISLAYAETGTNQGNLYGLIASSPALRVHLNAVMKIKKFIGTQLAEYLPDTTMPAGLDPSNLSHDLSVGEAYMKDPLVHGDVSFRLGSILLNAGDPVIESADNVRVPTYIFHGKEDLIANYTGSVDYYNNLVVPDKKINLYDGMRHETMNEFPKDRNRVLSDLRSWIDQH